MSKLLKATFLGGLLATQAWISATDNPSTSIPDSTTRDIGLVLRWDKSNLNMGQRTMYDATLGPDGVLTVTKDLQVYNGDATEVTPDKITDLWKTKAGPIGPKYQLNLSNGILKIFDAQHPEKPLWQSNNNVKVDPKAPPALTLGGDGILRIGNDPVK